MRKSLKILFISVCFIPCFNKAADRDEQATEQEIAKRLVILYGELDSERSLLAKNLKIAVAQKYNIRLFEVSEKLTNPLMITVDPLMTETSWSWYNTHKSEIKKEDEFSAKSSLLLLSDLSRRFKKPENSKCYYIMPFWSTIPVVLKRFESVLHAMKGEYLLVSVNNSQEIPYKEKTNHKLSEEIDELTNQLTASPAKLKKTKRLEIPLYKKKTKQQQGLSIPFDITVDTRSLREAGTLATPRTSGKYKNDVADPYSPRPLEQSSKARVFLDEGTYEYEAMRIAELLRFTTRQQELNSLGSTFK